MPSVGYSDTRLERWMWQECRDNSLEDLQLTAASAQMSKSKEEKIDSKAIKVEVAELDKFSERKDIIGLGDNMESSRDDMGSRPTLSSRYVLAIVNEKREIILRHNPTWTVLDF